MAKNGKTTGSIVPATADDEEAAGQGADSGAARNSREQVLKESLQIGRDTFGRSGIFGRAITHGDVVVIPVGRLRGGAGGGGGSGTGPGTGSDEAGTKDVADELFGGEGTGHGWGVDAKATGAYVIAGSKVKYLPAVDVNRIVVAGIVGLVAALILTPRIIRQSKD